MAGAATFRFRMTLATALLVATWIVFAGASHAADRTWPISGAQDDKALIEALTKRVEQLEQRLRELKAPVKTPKTGAVGTPSDAALLYQAALDDFAADRPKLGRRALALLIARYPKSPEAALARQRLRSKITPQKQVGSPSPQLGSAEIQPAAAITGFRTRTKTMKAKAMPTRQAVAAPGWEADVRRSRELTGDFKLTAGDRLFFPQGGVRIGASGRKVLAAQAAWLKRHASARVRLEGHADDLGTAAYNRDLARQRVRAVRARLIALGIAAERVRTSVLGNTKPVAICPDPACKAQNRRVVAVVTAPAKDRNRRSGIRHITGAKVRSHAR